MFSIRSIKKYLLSHDNYLTRLIPWLFTFLGGNKIKNRGDNRICISGNYLKKSRIIINGTGNTIQFGKVILAGNPAAVVKKGVRWIAERM